MWHCCGTAGGGAVGRSEAWVGSGGVDGRTGEGGSHGTMVEEPTHLHGRQPADDIDEGATAEVGWRREAALMVDAVVEGTGDAAAARP